MPHNVDTLAEELGRSFTALLKASRIAPDAIQAWQVFADLHAREQELRLDAAAPGDALEPFPGDPLVFFIRAQSIMLNASVELGLRWQRLLARAMPDIRQKLDLCREEEDPYPEDRQALLSAMRRYLQELKWLVADAGRSIEEDIEELHRQLLPPDDPDLSPFTGGMPGRYGRAAR
jgi:hypothetical protein